MSSNKNIPQLRFPGFMGEWTSMPLSFFLHEHKTKSDGKCIVHSVSVSKGVVNQVEYLGRSFAAADTSKYNLAKPNDIIYTKSPTGDFPYGIVKMNKNPYNVIVSPLYAVYSPINKYIGYILDSYFESAANTNNYLSSLVQKGAKNTINITNDTFASKEICLPTDEDEQKKIASFLMEMDAMISAQRQKVDALKEKKKGMMQQLFPQNGETTPRLRFPGFTGKWKEEKVGNIGDVITGSTPSKKEEDNWGGDFCWVSAQDMKGKYILDTKEKVTEKGKRSCRVLPRGSVLVTCIASIGLNALTCVECATNQQINAIVPYEGFEAEFIYQSMEINSSRLKALAGQTAVPIVNKQQFSNFTILIPEASDEQKKIARCLSELDNIIAGEEAKLEALKAHKKGLMQQLFPQPSK